MDGAASSFVEFLYTKPKLLLIEEFDRRQGWADGKLHSCAHWLNFKVGLNLGAAREKVRVAHALPGVPKIAAAMARGEPSYSKVRALTRTHLTRTFIISTFQRKRFSTGARRSRHASLRPTTSTAHRWPDRS